jgi:hypothetical protein
MQANVAWRAGRSTQPYVGFNVIPTIRELMNLATEHWINLVNNAQMRGLVLAEFELLNGQNIISRRSGTGLTLDVECT